MLTLENFECNKTQRMSFHPQRWHVPYRNHHACCEKLWFVRSLYPNLPQMGQSLYHSMLMLLHDTMPSFMNFRRVLDSLESKTQASQCFAGNQRCPGVWNSFSLLAWDLSIKMSKRTSKNHKNSHNTPIVLCWHEKKFESNERQWISFRPQRWDVPYRKPSCLLWEALVCEKHIPKPAPNGTENIPRHVDAAPWYHAKFHEFQTSFGFTRI